MEIIIQSHNILCIVIYNPPRTNSWAELNSAIMDIPSGFDCFVVVGDLNIDWKIPSVSQRNLQTLLYTFELHVVPFAATHSLDNSSSTIDYICINKLDLLVNFSQLPCPSISKHIIEKLLCLMTSYI